MRYLAFIPTLFSFTLAAALENPTPITVGVNLSETVSAPNIVRAAVANGKILKVRPVPPHSILITGLKAGTTSVRVWDGHNRELAYTVSVIDSDLYDQTTTDSHRGVVKISLEFLELNLSSSKKLGIKWPEALQFGGAAGFSREREGSSGLNYSATVTSARGMIQTLIQEGWAKMLANPDLYVQLGEQATFHSGGEIPIPQVSTSSGVYIKNVLWKVYGINVKVRPRSADRYHINSDIHVEVSEPNRAQEVDGIPAFIKRNVDTKMHSVDGETVVLSGLIRQSSSLSRESLPLLGSIPILGPIFFSAKDEASQETEILMAMTFSLKTKMMNQDQLSKFRGRYHEPRN